MGTLGNRLIGLWHNQILFGDNARRILRERLFSRGNKRGAARRSLCGGSDPYTALASCMARLRRISIMSDMERVEREILRMSDEPLQVRVETFNRLMFEFLGKYGPPGIQERLGTLLNKD